MANGQQQTVQVGLDISNLTTNAQAAARIFAQQAQLVGNLSVQYIKLNQASQQTSFALRGLNQAGQTVTATFQKQNQQFINTGATLTATARQMQNLGNQATQTGQQVQRAGQLFIVSWQNVARLLFALGIRRIVSAITTEIFQSVDAAIQYQKAIAEIGTIAQDSGLSFSQLHDRLLDLAADFNRNPVDVARATYEAFSNQIVETASDLNFMSEALRFSRITVSTAEESVNLMSSAMNAFGFETFEAERVANTFFAAIDIGRFRAKDLANTFGRVAVTAAQMGVSFEETAGFLSLVTRQGVPAAEAQTQLNAILKSLLTPSEQMAKLLRELGFSSGQAALDLVGLSGVLRIFEEEAAKGGERLGDLLPNVRALRGFFGTTSAGQGLVEELEKLTKASEEAEKALAKIREAPGERLQEQFNKIAIFFQRDFGNQIIDSLLRVGDSFGGLQNLVKELTTVLVSFVKGLLEVVRAATGIVTFFKSMHISVGQLITYFVLYKTLQGVIALGTALLATRTTFLATSFLFLRSRLNPTIANLTAYHVHLRSIQATTTSSATGLALFGSRLAALAPGFITLGFVAVAALSMIDQALASVNSGAKEFEDSLKSIDENNERITREMRENNERNLQAFRKDTDQTFDVFGRIIQEAIKQIHALDDAQAEALKSTTREFDRATNRIKESQNEMINSIGQGMREAENEIRRSIRALRIFSDETDRAFFQRQLGSFGVTIQNAGPVDIQRMQQEQAALNRVSEGQIGLIQNRIARLREEGQRLFQEGTVESVRAARERYGEIEKLQERQFELENERTRRVIENQARIEASQTGQSVIRTHIVPTERLEAELQRTREEARQGELEFQRVQTETLRNQRQQLELEEERRDAINEAVEALKNFKVVNEQGQLRFQTPEEANRAIADQVARTQELIGVARLTTDEQIRLQQELGARTADSITRAIETRTLGESQALQLERVIGFERVRIIEENMRAHRAVAAQRVALEGQTQNQISLIQLSAAEEQRRAAEQELVNANQRARETLQTQTESRNELLRNAQQAIQDINLTLPRSQGLFGTSVGGVESGAGRAQAARRLVQQGRFETEQEALIAIGILRQRAEAAVDAANAAASAFDASRTEENATKLKDALISLADEQRRFFGFLATDAERSNNSLSQLDERARSLANSFGTSSAEIVNANQLLNQAETAATQARTQAEQLLETIAGTNPQMYQAIIAAREAGKQMAAGFQPVVTQLELIVQHLSRISGTPLAVPAILPPNADGGLLGGRFNSYGRDDRIISARTGEFIVNPTSTQRFYPQLVAMNRGILPSFAKGGIVSNVSIRDIVVNESKTPMKTGRAVISELRRESRRRGKII